MTDLEQQIFQTLRTIYDPEIPINIVDLGLVYGVETDGAGQVSIRMTLTAPNCPVAEALPAEVQRKLAAVPGVTGVKLELVFDPPWSPNRMSEAAKLALGIEDVVSIKPLER